MPEMDKKMGEKISSCLLLVAFQSTGSVRNNATYVLSLKFVRL